MTNRRACAWLAAAIFILGVVSTAEGAAWNLITPGETHYNEVVTRLGHPTVRIKESRAIKNVDTVVHAMWESSDAPEGYERVDILFDVDSLLPLIVVAAPADMTRSDVHEEYGRPERSETSKGGTLTDHYDILGLAVTFMPDGQTVRRMEFFEGARGRYGR